MTMTSFPWAEVATDIARRVKYLPAARRDDAAQDALLSAYGRFSRQPSKDWTVSMLSSGGMLDVAKRHQRAFGRDVADSETVALLAVAPAGESSDGLDDLLAGLCGRDRIIATAWSDGQPDTVAADLAGCSVRTVCTVRVQLRDRLAARV